MILSSSQGHTKEHHIHERQQPANNNKKHKVLLQSNNNNDTTVIIMINNKENYEHTRTVGIKWYSIKLINDPVLTKMSFNRTTIKP